MQKEAINFYINYFSNNFKISLSFESVPDEKNRIGKDIDGILLFKNHKIALEHTSIDCIVDQRDFMSKRNKLFSKDFLKILENKITVPGSFTLLMSAQATLKGFKFDKAREIISDWIIKTTPTLDYGKPLNQQKHKATLVTEKLPFKINLYRFKGKNWIKIYHSDDINIENELEKGFFKAFNDKLEKLSKYKFFRKVLLIELEDSFISYDYIIEKSFKTSYEKFILSNKTTIPDEIYLVNLFEDYLKCLKFDKKLFPDEIEVKEFYLK